MGYACYTVTRRGEEIEAGYDVPDVCNAPDCTAEIDRGLDGLCGETPGGDEHGCGGYFCGEHLYGGWPTGRCARCLAEHDKPSFIYRAYGVDVDWVGDDGDMVAHGHVAPRRFIAAANRVSRTAAGLCNITDDPTTPYTDLLPFVEHTYAVRLSSCDCDQPDACPACSERYGFDADPTEWRIAWRGITATMPGAFPITLGLWS